MSAPFSVGDVVEGEGFSVQILEIRDEAVRLDRLIPRREAAEVANVKVEVSLEIWTGHFVPEWDTSTDEMEMYLDMVPLQLPSFEMERIIGDVLHEASRGLKTVSVRGCDGWACGELKLLPVP